MGTFERFEQDYYGDGPTVRVPQREHLGTELRPGVCCDHDWVVVPEDEETREALRRTFEETDLGSEQGYCALCGALSLWDFLPDRLDEEQLMVFAYDATARFGRPKREQHQPSPRRGQRRER